MLTGMFYSIEASFDLGGSISFGMFVPIERPLNLVLLNKAINEEQTLSCNTHQTELRTHHSSPT